MGSSINNGIYSRLSSYTTLTALVNKRIYPIILPQDCELPAVVYQRISGPRIHAMGDDPGLTHPRYQITVISQNDYDKARQVADEVINAFKNERDATWGSLNVQASYVEDDQEFFDDESERYRIAIDLIIWAEE